MSHGHCFYFFRGVDPGGELAEMRTMGGPRWLDEPRIGRISRHGKHIPGPDLATFVIRKERTGRRTYAWHRSRKLTERESGRRTTEPAIFIRVASQIIAIQSSFSLMVSPATSHENSRVSI